MGLAAQSALALCGRDFWSCGQADCAAVRPAAVASGRRSGARRKVISRLRSAGQVTGCGQFVVRASLVRRPLTCGANNSKPALLGPERQPPRSALKKRHWPASREGAHDSRDADQLAADQSQASERAGRESLSRRRRRSSGNGEKHRPCSCPRAARRLFSPITMSPRLLV